jgi:hypothetical protein
MEEEVIEDEDRRGGGEREVEDTRYGLCGSLACINNSFKLKNNKNSTIFQKKW